MSGNGAGTWPRTKLEDCVDLLAGFAFKSQGFTDDPEGIALVKGENVGQGRILWDISKRWPASDWWKFEKFRLQPGDVVVAMDRPWVPAGLKWSFIGPDHPRALLVQRCARLRSRNGALDQGFLRFLIGSSDFENYVKPITTGVNVPHISGKQILDFEFSLPPVSTQQRIASILSAYDDLIENCERRIRVLDEMARALYREWFVFFRYPGHERVSLADTSLGPQPRTWKYVDLAEVAQKPDGVQTGPFGSQLHQADYTAEGVPVVMPKDLRTYRIDTTDIARIPEDVAARLNRHRMQVGDIVYGRRGDIGRRAFVMPHQKGWLCGTGCLRIRPDSSAIDGWYLFQHLGREDIVALIAGRAQGVTMPNLNTKLLSTVPVALPPRELQDRFRSLTYPLAAMRDSLSFRMENLRNTRDLLLPRLLSGQLDLAEVA